MPKKDTPAIGDEVENSADAPQSESQVSPATETVHPESSAAASSAEETPNTETHAEPHDQSNTSGTSAPSFAAESGTSAPGGTTSYPPLPPRKTKKSLMARLISWPALVALLVIIILALFIWGITVRESAVEKLKTPQKVLHVAPIAAPGVAPSAQPAPKLTAAEQQELMSARAAYWHHDIPTAIERYRRLIQQVPDAAFAYGELGNVYYMNGDRLKAAHSFERAAMLLIQQGQSARAATLIPVLGALDPGLAQKVQIALSHSPEDDGYGASTAQ